MKEDNRLKDIHRIQREISDQKFTEFFDENPYLQIDIIIVWLCKQLKNRISENGNSVKRILFDELKLPQNIIDNIRIGDDFYNNLLNTEKWVYKDSVDLVNETPFTYALTKVYNDIWEFQNEQKSSELAIYSELQKHLIELMGEVIAHDAEYNTIDIWDKIYNATCNFSGFYNKWLYNIDINLITTNLNQLIQIPSEAQLHDLATFMEFRQEKEKHSKTYLENLKKLEQKSDWKFVHEATRSSDLLTLEENLFLKENLILRTNLKNWVKWLDNLKFPVLQDHAFYSIKKLDSFHEIIRAIVSEKDNLRTRSERLMLIALKNWLKLLENISSNLFYLKSSEWAGSYSNIEGGEDIIRQAENDYTDWTNKSLEEHCTTIFELIFKTAPVSDSKYFKGIFEWINSYTRQNHLNKKSPEPYLKTLETVSEKFQTLLCKDKSNKNTIIDSVEQAKLNWQFLESFFDIYMSDESDEAYKEKLFSNYLSFLESPNFEWNTSNEYNNGTLNQACYFAYVISKQNTPYEVWAKLYQKYKCWHEGWNYNVFSEKGRTNIENYLLTVGVCLSHTFYKNNNLTEAKLVFEKLFNILISQYRVSGKYKLTEYTIPFRFLSHVKANFCPQEIEDFINQLNLKIDDIEDLLPVYCEICNTLKEQQSKLSDKSSSVIQFQLTNNFWIIDVRYNDHSQKNKLQYFTELKKEIYSFLKS